MVTLTPAETTVSTLYCTIMRELFEDGESTQTIQGSLYHFDYSDFGTEITVNGDFLCEITQSWELRELLEDLHGI